jgi:hypothetical protein
MVRAANSLLSITHSIKLLLLLSDEAQLAHRRDAELGELRKETQDAKAEVAELLDGLFRRKGNEGWSESGQNEKDAAITTTARPTAIVREGGQPSTAPS